MKVFIKHQDGFMRRLFRVWSSMCHFSDFDRCPQHSFIEVGPGDSLILQADRHLSRPQIESMKMAFGLWRDGTSYPLILDCGVRVVGVRRSVGNHD